MPELPEVETIRLGLASKIIGLKIKNIEIINPKSFSGDPKNLINKKVTNVWRKAKVLGVTLNGVKGIKSYPSSMTQDDNAVTLLIHLKMSGQIILQGKEKFIGGHPTKDMFGSLPNRSTRIIFTFDNESKLYFNDQRKFGWIKAVNDYQLTNNNFLMNLGPEPLEESFTWQLLKTNLLKHKTQKVKVSLLDQTIVSGLGNIYVCEALFNAKINPLTKITDLTDEQFKLLHKGIVKVLKDGIKYGGSSKTHFVNESGKKGLFLNYAFVYSREGEPCKVCQTKIEKIKLGGRGTTFCPNCQA